MPVCHLSLLYCLYGPSFCTVLSEELVVYLILYSEVVYGLCFRMGVDVLFDCIMFCGLTCRDREDVPLTV